MECAPFHLSMLKYAHDALSDGKTLLCKILTSAIEKTNKTVPGLLYTRARCMIACNRLQEAKILLEREISTDPSNFAAKDLLQSLPEAAFSPTTKLGDTERFSTAYTRELIELLQIVTTCISKKECSLGSAIIEQFNEIGISRFPGLHYLYALCLQEQGRFVEAARAAAIEHAIDDHNKDSLRIISETVQACINDIKRLADNQDIKGALTLSEKLVHAGVESEGLFCIHAQCLLLAHRVPDALSALESELKAFPKNDVARAFYQQLQQMLGAQ